ncbi:hypothetical protein EMCRGX_G033066 [Ephydatia muelleri]
MMRLETYDKIIATIGAHGLRRPCIKVLSEEHPNIPRETLLSIYSQHYQMHTKRIHGQHRQSEVMEEYFRQYEDSMRQGQSDPKLLLNMAQQVQFSPVLFARIILEKFSLSRGCVTPESNLSTLVSQWIKKPTSIPDNALCEQVKACILNDPNYGPMAENIKHSVGHEYEFLLKEKLQALSIPFLDEHDLRSRGYDKTPDFKLEIPIASSPIPTAVDKHIIHWIESKASFGDEHSHSRYLEDQFWSYQNRFGAGLVIYWFGYVTELDVNRDQGILLSDSFPNKESIFLLHTS